LETVDHVRQKVASSLPVDYAIIHHCRRNNARAKDASPNSKRKRFTPAEPKGTAHTIVDHVQSNSGGKERQSQVTSKFNIRGLTLAELMFIITIVGIVTMGVLAASCSGPEQKNTAKREAAQWAKELGIEYSGISCADYDSDNDGYVSCTIATKNGDTKSIECRGVYSIGHGCRDPKLNIRGVKQ
jgi:hypothetical protein